jgi:lambda family phage minor tail protein L
MPDIVSTQSLLDLDPDSFVDLFEIYVDESSGILRFHAGKNFNNFIIYKGNRYTAAPIEYGGFEFSSDGKQSRPTIKIANINGVITDVIKNKNDLINCSLKRIKIFVKNLDDVNFSDNINPYYGYRAKRYGPDNYGTPFLEETYVINRKTQENKYSIDFQLSSPIDYENQSLPNRKISDNLCSWNYRGCGCNYGKIPWRNNLNESQSIFITGEKYTANQIFGSDVLNIGIPFADENNKEFFSPNGYGLTNISFRNSWNSKIAYNSGDFVTYSDSVDYNFFGDAYQFSEDNISLSVYVCVQTGNSGKDPRYNKEYWVKDNCSKNIQGCALRWFGHKDGLPYGGFPGTRPYNYQT